MLNRCIGTGPQEFARTHWGRCPLLTRSEALPRDFTDLLSPAAVDELLAARGVRAPFIRVAKDGRLVGRESFLGPAGFGAEIADQVDTGKMLEQFAAGASIVLQGLHRLWPPVIDFVRALVTDLGHPVQANAYVTPPDNRGFDPHYDVHDVFVLQVSGHKEWTVHRPVHADPLPDQPWTDHRADVERRAHDEPVIDTVLAPGDALYLPRGWVHSARAREELSIHLTIGVEPLTRFDVARAIVAELAGTEEFRASLPIAGHRTRRDELAAGAAKVMADLADALRDGKPELAERVSHRLMRRFAERTRPAAVRPLATLDVLGRAGTVPVALRDGLVTHLVTTDTRVALRLADRTIEFPRSCADALTRICDGATVTASQLPGLDAADGEVVIRRLLREAVVVPAGTG